MNGSWKISDDVSNFSYQEHYEKQGWETTPVYLGCGNKAKNRHAVGAVCSHRRRRCWGTQQLPQDGRERKTRPTGVVVEQPTLQPCYLVIQLHKVNWALKISNGKYFVTFRVSTALPEGREPWPLPPGPGGNYPFVQWVNAVLAVPLLSCLSGRSLAAPCSVQGTLLSYLVLASMLIWWSVILFYD